jgi:DNA polymerase-3 subunit gamma/tau
VGKTTCARILAKRINEVSLGKAVEDEDFAFNIFELDAASNNSVDDIRNLTDQVRIPPQTGKYKVYIIDEVHMLSQSAFNAFLKTLEEPPAHAIFILATTEKHKIIPTILSRCQIFDFKRIGVVDIKNYLHKIAKEEIITADDDALHIIAQKADGALRDALSIFDRVVSFSGDNLTRQAVTDNLNVLDYDVYFNITNLLIDNQIPQILIAYNHVLDRGFDGHHFISGLASHFRDLLVAKDPATVALLEVGDTAKKQYLKQAEKADLRFLLQAIDLANDCDLKYKSSKNQRLLVELSLLKIASITFDAQKKKSKNFIIPAAYFLSLQVEEKLDLPKSLVKKSSEEIATPMVSEEREKLSTSVTSKNPVKPKITLEQPTVTLGKRTSRRNSALSLSSIHVHDAEIVKGDAVDEENLDNLPKDPFTEETFLKIWKSYIEQLHEEGEKIFASILKADTPTIKNNMICVTYPNKMMKAELIRVKPKALRHLRKELNNYSVDFKVTVNEENTKKFAYTPQEKYELLKSKNEALATLRKAFNLEL